MDSPTQLDSTALVDEYFIENRTRVLEVAAFLDRVSRADPEAFVRDFRLKALTEALESLLRPELRVDHIQVLFSDPSVEPLGSLDRKSALGAYDHGEEEGQA